MITFNQWLERKEIPIKGWSKNWKKPAVGFRKDVSPEHPSNAQDPENDPHDAERGVTHHHKKAKSPTKIVSPGGAAN